jgi:hypothetical protein
VTVTAAGLSRVAGVIRDCPGPAGWYRAVVVALCIIAIALAVATVVVTRMAVTRGLRGTEAKPGPEASP